MFAKRFAALAATSIAILFTGCVAMVPYTPKSDLVSTSNRESVQTELQGLVKHATAPVITNVAFSDDTVTFELAANQMHMWWGVGGQAGRVGIHLPTMSRADLYENNKVFLRTASDQNMIEVMFSNQDHAKKFADLMMSLKQG